MAVAKEEIENKTLILDLSSKKTRDTLNGLGSLKLPDLKKLTLTMREQPADDYELKEMIFGQC